MASSLDWCGDVSRVIEVSWLGPVTIRVDGQAPPPEVLWRKHLALAVVLWAERHRLVSRDRLLGLLWPDRPEAAARHSLNEALRVLRRAFDDSSMVSTADAVGWIGEVTFDTEAFRERAEDDPITAANLVRGNWCEGLIVPDSTDFEEWVATERDQWRSQLVAILVRAAGILADRGDATGLHLAEHALKLHPWSDQAAIAVMQARWLAGDRAGAVAAGCEHERRLSTDLGATPAPETMALLSRLRRGTMTQTRPAAPAGRELPPLLLREPAVSAAKSAWDAMHHGASGGIIAFIGAPGSGRSRVLQELVARLETSGAVSAVVRAVPGDARDATQGLHAVADAIARTLPGLGGGDPAAIATLAAGRPVWAERFPGALTERQLPLPDALAAVLRAASEETAVAVVVDDLDRFHPDAIASLVGIARELSHNPVTFLVTTVAESDNPGVDALARVVGAELPGIVVPVPPLSSAHAEALVGWGLPSWESAAQGRLARRLVQEAGGSVFIAVEVLEAVRSGFALPDASQAWPSPGETFDDTLPRGTPHALTLALRHAFRQLSTEAQQLLQQLSIRPEPAVERDLTADWPQASMLAAFLDQLEARCWLVSDHRGYHFAARAVRRFVAQDTLTPGQRRRYECDSGTALTPDR